MMPRVAREPAVRWMFIVSLIIADTLCGGLFPALALGAATEPTYERAAALWPDIRRPITFVGCKDHTDEFAVMWNGNISAQTSAATDADRRLFQGRKDDSLQLTFSAGEHPHFENREQEDGSTSPSLRDGYLPVALIQRREEGVEMLQEAFATDERGMCTSERWDSPVFLRLRFTIRRRGEGSGPVRLWVQIAPNHTSYNTAARRNIRIVPVAPDYPRQLHQAGNLLLDSRGRVVLAANRDFHFHTRLEPPLASVALGEFHLDRNVVEFALPRAEGATVEMIVPFVPAPPDRMERAALLSHDQALAVVRGCWEREIGRGVQISVPEERLNQLWRYTAPITYIAADGYPGGEKILKPAPHQYEACWPTLLAIQVAALARMGYFAEAAAYLHPFLDAKRRKPVPNSGSSYLSAAGFMSGPGEHIAVSWVSDHGATLWAASDYYLLTRDASFLREWLPVLLEGVEWIAKEREQMTRAGGDGAGLMPAGRATDAEMQSQFVWNDAWSFRGLDAVCRVLKAIGHPDLARWERERNDYRDVFRRAFAAQIRRTVRWTDAKGADIPFIPWELGQTGAGALHAFYLDTGPMVLGSVGLVDPTDESMTWAMRWLTEGPDSGKGSPDWSDWKERPSLRYEISSAEPSCSWNIFLRFLRNERLQFLEGFYSLAAGAVSRKFNGGVETRDGINGVALTNAVLSTHLRNILLFEDPEQGGIELLRNAPAAWLKSGAEIRVQKAPTYFGETSFLVRSDGSRVQADIELPSRNPPGRVTLHLVHPEGKKLKSVRVNDRLVPVSTPDSVTIEKPPGRVKITAEFQSASTVQ